MTGAKNNNREDDRRRLVKDISNKELRKQQARKQGAAPVWFGLGMYGLVGWSVAIPTLAGIAAGVWIDSTFDTTYSWTLMLLFVGVVIGCLNAWYWVKREGRHAQRR